MRALEAQLMEILSAAGGILWGWPMILLLIASGVYFTFLLKGLQFRLLARSLHLAFSKKGRSFSKNDDGDISHFQALMTALSATVGTGNIAGVATAVAAGGPGAIFWMWVTGLLGMATKYAEAVLGVHYRVKNSRGRMSGGPMYYIQYGMGCRWLGVVYALLMVLGAIGIGNMVQSNSVADVMGQAFDVPEVVSGVLLTVLTGLVMLGGITRIGQVASAIVPFMILLYVGTGIVILLLNWQLLGEVFGLIFTDAFTGTAAAGGFLGAAVKEAMRYGFSRGAFSNEAGIGSAAVAAAAAKTKHPVDQAMVSMTQTFIDTIVVCTFTGVIIVLSGLWMTQADGAALTAQAFSAGLGLERVGGMIVSVCLVFFAFSTMIGWGYYGEKGLGYVFGARVTVPYRIVYIAVVLLGALAQLELVWSLAEVVVGLMIIPNVIALFWLSGKVRRLTIDYFRNERDGMGYQVKPFHNI